MTLSIALTALILAVLALAAGLWACLQVEISRRSTHTLQYVPLDEELKRVKKDKQGFEVLDEKTKERMEAKEESEPEFIDEV